MDDEDHDFWAEHPDPTDEDITDLCRTWVTYQRESRERDQQRGDRPPGPDDTIVAETPTLTVYARKRRPADADDEEDESGWWAAEAVMSARFNGGLPLQWRVILGLCAAVDPDDEWVIGMIGVGPIEEILFEHGDRAMDLIEPAADVDRILHQALTSVWCHSEPIRPRIDRYLARPSH
jgi:hypothetical protein